MNANTKTTEAAPVQAGSTPAISARWCPLCGTQHAVVKGAPNPWPHITRNQIEALPDLLAALKDIADAAYGTDTPKLRERARAAIDRAEKGGAL